MRRPLVIAAVTAGLLLALVPSGSGAPPKAARDWLGKWTTNFGELLFISVFRAKSETTDANGNPQFYWAIHGTWDPMGSGPVRTIKGVVSERNHYLSIGGCWIKPSDPSQCNSIFIYRKGDEITGGYWKPCRLACSETHHPWRSVGDDPHQPARKLSFRFTQRGFPDGRHEIETRLGGAGTLIAGDDDFETSRVPATANSRIFAVDHVPEGSDLHTTLRVDAGKLREDSNQRTEVVLFTRVTQSDRPECPGTAVAVYLTDGHHGLPDKIEMLGDDGKCFNRQSWTSTDPARVNVHVSEIRDAS